MHYLALACDYDGTLAKDGTVSQQTITALEQVVASGRKLLLITGRLLQDLQQVFSRLDLFAYVVAENGALLYQPASSTETLRDYSRWFREVIKDDDLAREVESIEKDAQLTPRESRARIRSAIEQRYTLPS